MANVSFAEMSAEFGKMVQDKTNSVYSDMKSMTGSNLTPEQSMKVTQAVNELGLVTQQLMNAMKTYKSVFDKINRTVD